MRIGFMSSAAPQWDLETLLQRGRELGFSALEPRVEWKHAHGLERDQPAAWSHARTLAAEAGMAISAVALGSRLNRPTPEERQAAVAEIAAYAEQAARAGATVMRVFGGPMPQGWTMEQARPPVAEALGQAAVRCAAFGVTPCLETHDAFWNPRDVAWCLEHAGHSNVGATWHAAHHLREGRNIGVDEALGVLGPWVRHVHMQEVPADNDQYAPGMYPLPLGEGDGSARRLVELLAKRGYDGTLSLEWINNAQQPVDPLPALRHYAATLRGWLRDVAGLTVQP